MKKLLFLLLLVCVYSLHAQTGEKIAYYYHGQKQSFSVNNARFVVQLAASENFTARRSQLATALQVPDTTLKIMGNQKLLSTNFPSGTNPAKIKERLATLLKQGIVDFVHPCFTSAYGKDMGYGNDLVVKLKTTTSVNVFNNFVKQSSCTVVKKYPFSNDTYIIGAGAANNFDALSVANRFYETGLFVYAEPDLTLFDGLFTNPNDPLFDYQWSHTNTGSAIQYNGVAGTDMKIQQAWAISTGAGITVAVIDEGVDTGHADLKANLLQGFDCLSGTSNPGDGRPLGPARAHGTNCTGIIAAIANNNIGIAGVAPDCKIIPINLAAANGAFTSYAGIASGFDYAWTHGADVISNSWGGGSPSSIIEDAINRAVTLGRGGKGSVVLFASGNNNAALSYPAVLVNVISVGGVNMCGQRKSPASSACDGEGWGASYGTGLDVSAPCVKIASTDISGSAGYNTNAGAAGDYFLRFNGTSSATPATAGVTALILSANNNLTVSELRNVLEGTCDKLPLYSYSMVSGQPNGTWNNETGYGLINAFHAVQVAASGIFCHVQIQANGATRFCPGGNVNLSVTNPVAGTSYQWRKDGSNFNTGTGITASIAGSYDVVATASNGCVATSSAIIVNVLINSPVLVADAGIDTFICAGQPVKLGGNPVASGGAPWLSDERAFGMDWQGNSFVKFSLTNPLKLDTIATNVVSLADYNANNFFTGGDFTPYGYYAITQTTNKLIKVDTATGAQQLIGNATAPAGYVWSGMSWDAATKNLYGIASASSGTALCIIDPFTAAVSLVAIIPVGLTEWVAVSNNGNMYVMSDNNYVYSVNKTTGAATALSNPVGADVIYEQDADFDPVTDKLYLTTLILSQNYVGDLRTVDTNTGISSVIGTLGGLSEIDATGIAGPGYQYSWSPAATLNRTDVSVPVATALATTTYTLNVTDMCGNTASSQVTVHITPAPQITAPTDSICVGETVRLSAIKDNLYTYQWYRNGTMITGATDSFYVAGKGGVYTVTTQPRSCSLSLPFTVKTCEIRMNSNTAASLCSSYFYDSGGPDTAYSNNESFTRTVTASIPGNLLRLTLNSFASENGTDVLTVYDGPSMASPVLATLSGSPSMPLVISSSSAALTFNFTSNGSTTAPGWSGTINCFHSNVYRSKNSGNADDINTWEVKSGSSFINATDIPTLDDDSIIIRPGHTVTVNSVSQLDQIWVQYGAVLNIAAALTLNNGTGNDLLVDGSLMIAAGGSIIGNGIITLTGSLDNSASASSNILVRTEVTGNTSQNILAGGSFSTLYIVNPFVSINLTNSLAIDTFIIDNGISGITTITASNPVTLLSVGGGLTLNNGRVIMVQNAILNVLYDNILTGGSTNSFVEGEMQVTSTNSFPNLFFPVGKDVYRPVTVNVLRVASSFSTFQVHVLGTAPTSRTIPSSLNSVSGLRYYRIIDANPAEATLHGKVTLSYGPNEGVTDPASLRIAHEDGGANWTDIGGSGTAVGTGSITSTVDFSLFYPDFVLANALNGANLLPVTWVDVSAKPLRKNVIVEWKTTNEINVAGYSVERSSDGIAFNNIGSQRADTSNAINKLYQLTDLDPLKGNNYYRILQTDKDGRFTYSKTVLVNFKESILSVWPNPAAEMVTIHDNEMLQRVQVYNGRGQLLYDLRPASSQLIIPVKKWPAGVYNITITAGGNTTHTRFVKQ